jgi:hypothetical protein
MKRSILKLHKLKIKKVIGSCITLDQIRLCVNWIDSLAKKETKVLECEWSVEDLGIALEEFHRTIDSTVEYVKHRNKSRTQ